MPGSPRSVRSVVRPLSGVGLALIAAAGLAAGGCSLLSPSEAEVYVLSEINGQPLPAPHVAVRINDGGTYEFQVIRSTLKLLPGRRFVRELEGRDVWSGVPAESLERVSVMGQYERTDTTIVVRFTESNGGPNATTYRILENGHVLRGLQSLAGAFEAVYEYTRD
jgi:hypothetical protein